MQVTCAKQTVSTAGLKLLSLEKPAGRVGPCWCLTTWILGGVPAFSELVHCAYTVCPNNVVFAQLAFLLGAWNLGKCQAEDV